MSAPVLDTSALLAWLRAEPGAETVQPVLGDAVINTVNWAELARKLVQNGVEAGRTLERLQVLGVRVEPFPAADALRTGELWPATKPVGLSLGDCACLATALRLRSQVLTADQAWKALALDLDIQLIR